MMIVYFPPWHTGGAEKQCWVQARALAARGHKVTILTEWWVGKSPRRENVDGVQILRMGLCLPLVAFVRRMHDALVAWWQAKKGPATSVAPAGGFAGRAPGRLRRKRFRLMAPIEWIGQLSFLVEVAWTLKTKKLAVDVVHVHESHWLSGFAHWVAGQLHVPVVCTEHSPREALIWPGMRDVPGLARWKARRAGCTFLSISARTRRSLEAQGIPGAQIVDVPNGVEIPERSAPVAGQNDVIYVGNFTQGAAHKAFDVLLTAWGIVHGREPLARLHLYGSGDFSAWRQYATAAGCGAAVIFEGKTDCITGKLLASGMFVLPSRWEGLSCALLEAQAAGLPAVVSDIEGNVEIVVNGVNGIVVPVGDADALAAAILKLYRSADLRIRMGRAARKRVEDAYAIEKVAALLETTYAHVRAIPGTHT